MWVTRSNVLQFFSGFAMSKVLPNYWFIPARRKTIPCFSVGWENKRVSCVCFASTSQRKSTCQERDFAEDMRNKAHETHFSFLVASCIVLQSAEIYKTSCYRCYSSDPFALFHCQRSTLRLLQYLREVWKVPDEQYSVPSVFWRHSRKR